MELCEDVLLYILKFIPNKSKYLSNFQLVCKDYKQVLQKRLDKVYWNKIENLVGKDNTNKMKQGSEFQERFHLFNNNRIDAKACKHLAPALSKMTALVTLWLGGNQIDAKACKHLAPALAKMTALKTLDLNNNQIGAKGCEHLAPALAKMTALEELDLSNNEIAVEGDEMMRELWENSGKSYGLYL